MKIPEYYFLCFSQTGRFSTKSNKLSGIINGIETDAFCLGKQNPNPVIWSQMQLISLQAELGYLFGILTVMKIS